MPRTTVEVQVPWLAVADTNVRPVGSTSSIVTVVAGKGPFVTVVANAIVTCDDYPAMDSRFSQPHNIFCALREQLVMHSDLDTSGTECVRHLLSASAQ